MTVSSHPESYTSLAPAADVGAPEVTRVTVGVLGRRVAGGLALSALFLVVFESATRVEDWVRYRTPFFSPYRSQSDLVVRDEKGMHGRPYARFGKWVMNGLGMRGPSASAMKMPGTFRIITVGASETFGLYETIGKEYPRQLEDSLEAIRRSGRCRCAWIERFEVLNGAVPGMSLPTVVQDVSARLAALQPDVVIHYTTPSMYLWNEPPRAARPDSSGAAYAAPLLADRLYPRSLERVRMQVKSMLPGVIETWLRDRQIADARAERGPDWQFTVVPRDRLAQFTSDLTRLVEAVRAIGATPVLVTHANAFPDGAHPNRELLVQWLKFYPRATGPVLLAFDTLARQTTLEVGRTSDAPVVDVQAALHQQRDVKAFSDFSHFTDAGAGVAAERMAKQVVELARRASVAHPPAARQRD